MHQKLADHLEEQVKSGQLKPGDVIELSDDLKKQFDLNEEELALAMSDLVYRGVIEPQYNRQFQQLIVSPGSQLGTMGGILSLTKEAIKRGMTPGVRVLSFEILPAWDYLSRNLAIEPGEKVVIVERLRLVDEEPIAMETSYIPEKLVPGITQEMFEGKGKKQSSFDLLDKQFGIHLMRAVDVVVAVPVRPREARLLHMAAGTPILLRERTTYDDQERLAKWSRAFFKTRSQYEMALR